MSLKKSQKLLIISDTITLRLKAIQRLHLNKKIRNADNICLKLNTKRKMINLIFMEVNTITKTEGSHPQMHRL